MTDKEAYYELDRMKTWSKDLSDDEIKALSFALKSISKQREWIPVSERLPEEETTVLICTDQGDIDASRIFSYSDGTWEWFASSWCYGEIIAWMPLPEPYIERGNENG